MSDPEPFDGTHCTINPARDGVWRSEGNDKMSDPAHRDPMDGVNYTVSLLRGALAESERRREQAEARAKAAEARARHNSFAGEAYAVVEARALNAEAQLAAARGELGAPDKWPLHLAARAAVDSIKALKAQRDRLDGNRQALEATIADLTAQRDEWESDRKQLLEIQLAVTKRAEAAEAQLATARADALREAAALVGVKVGHGGVIDCGCGQCAARREDHAAILALLDQPAKPQPDLDFFNLPPEQPAKAQPSPEAVAEATKWLIAERAKAQEDGK